jgi:hemolysin D
VQPAQTARVKLAAYPFQKYGMLDGVVRQVSVDAQERTNSSARDAGALQDAAYRALINLETGELESRGRRLRLVPGMLVSAEIHLGTRTVLEYLLSPVQHVAHEAGRER